LTFFLKRKRPMTNYRARDQKARRAVKALEHTGNKQDPGRSRLRYRWKRSEFGEDGLGTSGKS